MPTTAIYVRIYVDSGDVSHLEVDMRLPELASRLGVVAPLVRLRPYWKIPQWLDITFTVTSDEVALLPALASALGAGWREKGSGASELIWDHRWPGSCVEPSMRLAHLAVMRPPAEGA